MERYQIVADLHTHTCVSSHAFNTITEMALAAHQIGHKAIAITNHGYGTEDGAHQWHFQMLTTLPDVLEGVVALKGMEANVMDVQGTIDATPYDLKNLDWIIASIHGSCIPGPLTEEETTHLWLQVAKNPYVDMIGHSEQQCYPYDYERVIAEFAHNNKVVELNSNSFVIRPGGTDNMRKIIAACKRSECKIALNTDAHSIYHLKAGVGHMFYLLEEANFPPELIVNSTGARLRRELEVHKKEIVNRIGELLV